MRSKPSGGAQDPDRCDFRRHDVHSGLYRRWGLGLGGRSIKVAMISIFVLIEALAVLELLEAVRAGWHSC